jgi:poly-gamma-glutamate capsule biosynthesis protein CapA/YwtB (metallophosphatase superfamily)
MNTGLEEVIVAILIAGMFAISEIAVTLYATDKTTEKLMKHNDESERRILAKIEEFKRGIEVEVVTNQRFTQDGDDFR